MQDGIPDLPCGDRRESPHDDVGPVRPAFVGHEQRPCAGLIPELVSGKHLRAYDPFLKDAQGADGDVASGRLRDLLEGEELGDGAGDFDFRGKGEGVVRAVVDLTAPDYEFPVGGFPEVDADDGRMELDVAFDVRGKGVVVLGVPSEAFKLEFLGGFEEDVPGDGDIGSQFRQAVDRGFADAGEHDVDRVKLGGRRDDACRYGD